jgi:hypothetical protein
MVMGLWRRMGLQEWTILGNQAHKRCREYLSRHGLRIDENGRQNDCKLVVTCTDLLIPENVRHKPIVVVQEGILDNPNLITTTCRRVPFLPLWTGGTALTGLSGWYQHFCVASEGYRRYFIEQGVDPRRLVVTGIPNFDNCHSYNDTNFRYRDYVLVCTSDARETFKVDDRVALIYRAKNIAGDRQLLFKLHPNENVQRATHEIRTHAPRALIFSEGSAEEMVANCRILITQWSSLAFVGIALGKEVLSYFPREKLEDLLPWQNGGTSAARIAKICRKVIELGRLPVPQDRPIFKRLLSPPSRIGV